MRRALLVALLAQLILAVPARAELATCTYDAGTKVLTAAFAAGTQTGIQQGTLKVGAGGAIQRDAGATCGGATVTNTDRIEVTGDADNELITLDLAGGTFAPGATDEGDGSSEIEIHVDLGANGGAAYGIEILGTAGPDRILAGRTGTALEPIPQVNLNAAGDDHDSDLYTRGLGLNVLGRDGDDVLSDRGDPGVLTSYAYEMRLSGGEGDDQLTTNSVFLRGGPGDDTFTFPFSKETLRNGTVFYDEAAGPVTIELPHGTAPGKDGDGDTDTFTNVPILVVGSPFADQLNSDDGPTWFYGRQGGDTIDGQGGDDLLLGNEGADVIDGGDGDDLLDGSEDGDTLHGGAGDDTLTAGAGTDDVFGDAGDDLLDEIYETTADADELSGGADRDFVRYGLNTANEYGFTTAGRAQPVTADIDGVADDGEVGEGDNVRLDVEGVVGGLGNDTLIGNGDPNLLFGYDGADTLRGGGGDDRLDGVGIIESGFPDKDQGLRDAIADEGDDIDGEAGADTIAADEGDDTIEARDGTGDTIGCGPGTDGGRGDRLDTIASDCESIALPVDMPADPVATPPSEPPVVTPPPPVLQPPPIVQPPASGPAPPVAQLLTVPSSRRCASRRKFTVRVRREIRGQVKRVLIFINGRRVKTVTGTRIGLPIDLRGLPKGKIRVRLQVELLDGRTATDTRTYRTCATKKRTGQFGRRRG